MDYGDPHVLRELAERKEKEWKDVSEKRVQSLEAALAQKDKELARQSEKFLKLKDDFKYNLKLLEERDQELERYDLMFTDLKAQLNTRNAELSELRIHLDDAKKLQEREQQARDELHSTYQQRLREKQAEIEAYKNTKNNELQKERSEFESLRRTLQHQLTEMEADLDRQRHELSTEFEDALRKREHEFRVQVDEMSSKVLEYDLKAQLLSKELELVRAELQKHNDQAEEATHGQHDLEKQLKHVQWQLADTTAMKDARIKELEEKLRQQEKAAAHLQEDFQRKYAELDRSMREHEASAQRVKAACSEKEEALVQQTRDLQSKLEDAQIQIRQLQWTNNDLKKDHEMQVEKLRDEIYTLQNRWDTNLKEMSHDAVTRDVELQNLQEEVSRLRSDLSQRKDDLNRYKKELQQAIEREKSLEQAKTQLDLDWQRRCEELERRQYNKSEDLIASLTHARDEALATEKERSRELEQCNMLLRAVTRDRDLAMATLKKHDIPIDKNLKISENNSSLEVENLRGQNENLRAALQAMRQQMETLGHAVPTVISDDLTHDRNEYVASLEKKVKELKQENRDLAEKVAIAEKFGRLAIQPPPDSKAVLAEVKDTSVRNHIQSLNDMLGVLRGEKVELAAAAKKQQVRIQHLEEVLEEASKQPRELQVTVEQLRYETAAQQRRHAAETAALKQRISALETQLDEAQREADMFHQASVENNAELTALRNQMSALKLELAEKRPAVNFGAQELVIHQLKEELSSLRQRAAGLGLDPGGKQEHGAARTGFELGGSASELRAKLHKAARHIAQLAREKQQLIELSNKLRAELKQAGIQQFIRPDPVSKVVYLREPAQPVGRDMADRLSQLERLQYELTKQELQYAQRFTQPTQHIMPDREQPVQSAPGLPVQQSMTATASSLRASSALSGVDFSMSSAGGQSLQDVWRLLDSPVSPDIAGPRSARNRDAISSSMDKPTQERRTLTDSGDIAVSGQQVRVDEKKHKSAARTLSSKAAGRVQKVKMPERPRLRNYNVKNDSDVR
ncbi:hypothetical protein BaRGS_00015399 [Batillaria attramentaria]|uniref:Coiled-coil domain-containing protein 57 n=1 Tax=Batillaria attramentaria TaxID=370345 RepID=A0ABD0L1S8_9CAEN